jgi:hypothetical protein
VKIAFPSGRQDQADRACASAFAKARFPIRRPLKTQATARVLLADAAARDARPPTRRWRPAQYNPHSSFSARLRKASGTEGAAPVAAEA